MNMAFISLALLLELWRECMLAMPLLFAKKNFCLLKTCQKIKCWSWEQQLILWRLAMVKDLQSAGAERDAKPHHVDVTKWIRNVTADAIQISLALIKMNKHHVFLQFKKFWCFMRTNWPPIDFISKIELIFKFIYFSFLNIVNFEYWFLCFNLI